MKHKRKKEMNVSFVVLLEDLKRDRKEKRDRRMKAKLANLASAARACFM